MSFNGRMLYGPAPFPRPHCLPLRKLPLMDKEDEEKDDEDDQEDEGESDREEAVTPSPDVTISNLKSRILKVKRELKKAEKMAGMVPAWKEELCALEAALEAYERVRAATIVHGT